MGFGVQLLFSQELLGEAASLLGVVRGLTPLFHRRCPTRDPRPGFHVLGSYSVLGVVVAKFRLGRGIAVLAYLNAYVINDAGARRKRGDSKHKPCNSKTPLPIAEDHNSMMYEALESCKSGSAELRGLNKFDRR